MVLRHSQGTIIIAPRCKGITCLHEELQKDQIRRASVNARVLTSPKYVACTTFRLRRKRRHIEVSKRPTSLTYSIPLDFNTTLSQSCSSYYYI